MDHKLLAWGFRPGRGRLPRLWLFTDDSRLSDPRPSISGLPRGKAGVVFRHDRDPNRAALGRAVVRICRARRLVLVVAGDPRLAAALGVGLHCRGGRRPGPVRVRGVLTCSAHSVADLRRAGANRIGLAFLSPAFPTASHAGAPALGPFRWAAAARHAPPGLTVAALGGIDGRSVRRLPAARVSAVGAIGALSKD